MKEFKLRSTNILPMRSHRHFAFAGMDGTPWPGRSSTGCHPDGGVHPSSIHLLSDDTLTYDYEKVTYKIVQNMKEVK